ncbi:hypothetical protein MKW98_009945 [Papaver atlanticum]|uniref:Uncharacterized protein n=1 Tax=Papaver atlanticum TaxID=357466 RepID=A0AAD4XQK3_9MAGN|nr:hypothetical protein MKW98_009945 [Papaver atlanticum]
MAILLYGHQSFGFLGSSWHNCSSTIRCQFICCPLYRNTHIFLRSHGSDDACIHSIPLHRLWLEFLFLELLMFSHARLNFNCLDY